MEQRIVRLPVRLFAVAVATALAMTPASAEVVDIVWDSSGAFQRIVVIEPGKFAEVCGRLQKGESVAWSFKSGAAMNFNIHYHEGSRVVFPARHDRTASLEGKLEAPADQDYCWMWENHSRAKDTLSLVLRTLR